MATAPQIAANRRNAVQHEQALEKACLLARLAGMEGVLRDVATGFPEPNGFVFSTAKIAHAIRAVSRLKAATRVESPFIRCHWWHRTSRRKPVFSFNSLK
jgi:hypothetical protein